MIWRKQKSCIPFFLWFIGWNWNTQVSYFNLKINTFTFSFFLFRLFINFLIIKIDWSQAVFYSLIGCPFPYVHLLPSSESKHTPTPTQAVSIFIEFFGNSSIMCVFNLSRGLSLKLHFKKYTLNFFFTHSLFGNSC